MTDCFTFPYDLNFSSYEEDEEETRFSLLCKRAQDGKTFDTIRYIEKFLETKGTLVVCFTMNTISNNEQFKNSMFIANIRTHSEIFELDGYNYRSLSVGYCLLT